MKNMNINILFNRMKKPLCFAVAAMLILTQNAANARETYTTVETQNFTVLAETLLGPGVTIAPGMGSTYGNSQQIGIFSNLISEAVGFTNGVILSTGNIASGASLTNSVSDDQGSTYNFSEGDLDIENEFPVFNNTMDTAYIVLHVIPSNSTINIPFMFASEEFFYGAQDYSEPSLGAYEDISDRFACFLEPGIVSSSQTSVNFTNNIARLPSGKAVEIAAVNQHTNTAYFVANVETNGLGELVFPSGNIPIPMEYNGAIVGPTAVVTGIIPGAKYTIKIVVVDHKYPDVDSAVFLKGKGITSGADLALDVEASPPTLGIDESGIYTVTVRNVGPVAADDVVVTNLFPSGVTWDSSSPSVVDLGGNASSWDIGTLDAGASTSLVINATFPDSGVYTNAATVFTSTGDFDPSNNSDEAFITVSSGLPLTIIANDTNKVYGATVTFNGTEFQLVGSLQAGDSITSVTLTSSGAPATAPVSGSPYEIVPSDAQGVGLEKYQITYSNGWLTVTNAPLTITATAQSKPYGTTLTGGPLYTYFTVGAGQLQNGNTVDSVTVDYDDGDAATDPVGTYTDAINVSLAVGSNGFDAANYAVTYVDGTLEVTAVPLTITANDTNKVYGATVTFNGTEFTASGLKNSDTVTAAEIASAGAAASAPVAGSPYVISITNGVGVGLGNYTISYVPGLLTITNAPLTITATAQSKPYGTTLTGGPLYTYFTVGAGQLQNGNTVDSVTVDYDDGDAATDPVGTYTDAINVSLAVGSNGFDAANYAVTYEDGTLEVTAVPLTITANDTNKVYGATVTFNGTEFTASGLKNSDTVTAAEIASAGAAASAPVAGSPYVISITNGVGIGLGNYTISYVPGLLTITNAPLTITTTAQSKPYGAMLIGGPLYTYFTVGAGQLQNGNTVDSVTVDYDDGDAATDPVGTYTDAINVSLAVGSNGFDAENYAVTYVDGTLEVTAVPLTITANDTNKVYGATVTFDGTEFTTSGLKNSDTVTAAEIVSAGAAASAPVAGSPYVISITNGVGVGLGNYTISYVPGLLTITSAPLTITATAQSKPYGTTLTGGPLYTHFTVGAGQLQNGNTVDSVTVSYDGGDAATDPVGTYTDAINVSLAVGSDGFDASNYAVTYVDGTLTVTARALTIEVNNASRGLSATQNPAFSFKDFTAQLGEGDTMADITGGTGSAADVVFTLAATTFGSPSGVYTNEIGIATNSLDGIRVSNYTVMIDNGDLTILATSPDIDVTVTWTLNYSTGLFEGTLIAVNNGDGEIPSTYDYWFAITNTVEYRLYNPTGVLPDTRSYANLTDTVVAALRGTGNQDAVWNPGERITVTGLIMYHLRRVNPSKYIDPNVAFEYGKLFNNEDRNRNFKMDASELDAAASEWSQKKISTEALLEASRLGAGDAYQWNKKIKTWRVINKNEE